MTNQRPTTAGKPAGKPSTGGDPAHETGTDTSMAIADELSMVKMSSEVDQLLAALSAAQAEVQDVPLNGKNPYFKSKYATLGDVLQAARPIFGKHGLSLATFPTGGGSGVGVLFLLGHKSGQHIIVSATLAGMKDAERTHIQDFGAIVTYLRRYALCSILQIVGDEDLDGEEVRRTPAQAERPQKQPAQKPAGGGGKPAQQKPGPAKPEAPKGQGGAPNRTVLVQILDVKKDSVVVKDGPQKGQKKELYKIKTSDEIGTVEWFETFDRKIAERAYNAIKGGERCKLELERKQFGQRVVYDVLSLTVEGGSPSGSEAPVGSGSGELFGQ